MRQYQFKTLSPQFTRMPMNPPANFTTQSRPPLTGSTYIREQKIVSNPIQPLQPQIIRNNPTPVLAANAKSSPDLFNLQDMKKQLQNLLKKTQFLESKQSQNNISNKRIQAPLNKFTSLDKSYKTENNWLPPRNQRQQNYQKYDRLVQTSNNNQRLSAPIQHNSSFTQVSSNVRNYSQFQILGSPKNNVKNHGSISQIISQNSVPEIKNNNDRNKKIQFTQDIIKTQNKTPTTSRLFDNSQKINNLNNIQPARIINQSNNRPLEIKMPSSETTYSTSIKEHTNTNIKQFSKAPILVVNRVEQQLRSELKINITINKAQAQQIKWLRNKIGQLQGQNIKLQQNKNKLEQNKNKLEQDKNKLEQNKNKLEQDKNKLEQNQQIFIVEIKNLENKFKSLEQEQEGKIKQVKAHYQKQLQKITLQIQQIKKMHDFDIQGIKNNHKLQINQLNNQIQINQQKIITLIQQVKSYDSAKSFTQKLLTPAQVESIQNEEIQKLKTELQKKEVDIQNMYNQLKSRQQHIQLLNQTFLQLKSQIQELKVFKQSVETEHYSNFDQILLTQMYTINEQKQYLQNINEKTNQLRLSLIESQRKNQAMQNELKIMQLKHRTQLNSIRTTNEIQINNRDNQIGTLNKKMQTLEDKLKFSLNQSKRKDDFVKQYLVGRVENSELREHIEHVFSRYKQLLSENTQSELRAELEKAYKQIQLYQKYV